MPAAPQAGFKAVLKVGDPLSPTTIGIAKDVEITGTRGTIDVTSRASGGWKENIAGFGEWTAKIEMLWIFDDAGLVLLESAFLNGTTIHVSFEDENAKGYEGEALVSDWGRGEPLEDAVACSVSLKGAGALAKLP